MMVTPPMQHEHDFIDVNVAGQREIERWICSTCGARMIRETRQSEPIEVVEFS